MSGHAACYVFAQACSNVTVACSVIKTHAMLSTQARFLYYVSCDMHMQLAEHLTVGTTGGHAVDVSTVR